MKNKYSYTLFFISLLTVLVVAQNVFLYSQTSTVSTKNLFTTWRVGVVGVQADDFNRLSPKLQRSSLSLDALLNVMIKDVPTKDLSTIERYKAKEILRKYALLEIQKELDAAIIDADVTSLNNDRYDVWLTQITLRKKIKKIKKRMEKIENLKNEKIPVKNILPIQHIEQSEYITITPTADLENISKTIGTDQLFYYELKNLDETYVVVTIYSYNNLTKKTTLVITTAVDTNKIDQIQTSLTYIITQSILGTPFASLRINVLTSSDDPLVKKRVSRASILVDGNIVGFGSSDISVIRSGIHSIGILSGNSERTFTLSLAPGEKAVRNVFFDIQEQKTITIITKPAEARVYLNSEWLGNTPLVLLKPSAGSISQVSIRMSGFTETLMPLSEKTASVVTIALTPTNELPLKERLKRDRTQFYTAFAIFGISLVLPIILNGLYTNEAAFLTSASKSSLKMTQQEFNKAEIRRDALFYSYIGSSVLSGGLSIYAFIELTQYLRTASEYHKR